MAFSITVSRLLFLHHAFLMGINCELVDMSFPYENNMVTWPGMIPFNITLSHRGPFGKAPFVVFYNFKMGEHTGTHIDAPVHFAEGKTTVDEIPPESLITEAIVVDITEQSSKDRDYQLTVEDLKDWETKHGKIPDGSVLFLLTGFGKYWGNYEKYMGVNATHPNEFHWPAFGENAAQWLVDNRKIKGVGLDSRSLDVGQSKAHPAHIILLGNNIYGLESVANIEKLPVKGATVYVMPMKIKGGSGGPTRIIAQTKPGGRSSHHTTSIVGVLAGVFMATLMSMTMIMFMY